MEEELRRPADVDDEVAVDDIVCPAGALAGPFEYVGVPKDPSSTILRAVVDVGRVCPVEDPVRSVASGAWVLSVGIAT